MADWQIGRKREQLTGMVIVDVGTQLEESLNDVKTVGQGAGQDQRCLPRVALLLTRENQYQAQEKWQKFIYIYIYIYVQGSASPV